MGNNASCKVVDIGTIKIKMFNGVVRTLGNVTCPRFEEESLSLFEYSLFKRVQISKRRWSLEG